MTPITHPVALADQDKAAADELAHLMMQAAEEQRMHVSVRDGASWLNERFRHHMSQVDQCEHLNAGPRPAFTALWRPGLLVCRECLPQLDADDDGACDRCGTDVDEVVMTAVQVGPLLLLYALCEPCADADHAESTPSE